MYSPIGDARLIPPSTPRLKMAFRYPLSCTNQISAIEAGTSASIGAMQNPSTALAATSDAKLFASAAQKHEAMSPREVAM